MDKVDALLFSMLVLKGFNDGSGNVWRCFPNQLYLVEATYELVEQVSIYLLYVIVVTWAQVICLMHMPKARRLRAYILDKAQVPMLQLISYTSGTLKFTQNLTLIFPSVYIRSNR